jgi:hypothetical protein
MFLYNKNARQGGHPLKPRYWRRRAMRHETPDFRKGGRPRKLDLDKRTKLIAARVRPDELAAIEGRAAASNLPLSEFVRELALSGEIIVRAFRTLSAIDRHDLARIGSNLNQIARICNTTGDAYRAKNIEALLDELRVVLARLDAIGHGPDELGQR